MLQFSDATSISAACNIFGTTFGIGCWNLPPQKGEDIRVLQHSDIINFVDVDSLENQQQQHVLKFKEFIIAQGIELVFEAERPILSIRAQYSTLKANSPLVQGLCS